MMKTIDKIERLEGRVRRWLSQEFGKEVENFYFVEFKSDGIEDEARLKDLYGEVAIIISGRDIHSETIPKLKFDFRKEKFSEFKNRLRKIISERIGAIRIISRFLSSPFSSYFFYYFDKKRREWGLSVFRKDLIRLAKRIEIFEKNIKNIYHKVILKKRIKGEEIEGVSEYSFQGEPSQKSAILFPSCLDPRVLLKIKTLNGLKKQVEKKVFRNYKTLLSTWRKIKHGS